MTARGDSDNASTRGSGGFLPSLQILRFAAASMVLAHHLLLELATPRLAMPIIDPTGFEWSIGVDIFFMVSGFIMCFLTYRHFGEKGYWAEFLRRRFVRVAPLYWLFTSLMLILILTTPAAVSHNDLSAGRIASSYLFVPWPRAGGDVYPILGLGWTLNYEILFYLSYSVALCFSRTRGLAGLALIFLLATTFGRFLPASWVALRFWTDPIILEFLLGAGLGVAYLRGVRLGAAARTALIILGVGLSISLTKLGLTNHVDRDLWGGAPAFLIAAGAILGHPGGADGRLSPFTRLLVLCGDASYALYLSHMFSVRALTTVWSKLHWHAPIAYLACGLVLSTAVAVGVYLWIERPVLGLLKSVVRPKPGLAA
jgi:peptidoglycan/LPS O-acetylase OafA/YrhL